MPANCFEQLTNETIRRPIGQSNLASTLADACQFGSSTVLVGGKHHAEHGNDNVEAPIRERQRFCVSLPELHVEAVSSGALAGTLKQRGHVVGGNHITPATRSRERRVAVAGSHIEHLLS